MTPLAPLPWAVTFDMGRTHLTVCSEHFASGDPAGCELQVFVTAGVILELASLSHPLLSPSSRLLGTDKSHQRLVQGAGCRVKDPRCDLRRHMIQ